MLHPFRVIAVGEILAGMGATAFLASERTGNRNSGLDYHIIELKRFDKVRVPDERPVGYANVANALPDVLDKLKPFVQDLRVAEHGAVVLHDTLHLAAQLGRRRTSRSEAHAVQPLDRLFARVLGKVGLRLTSLNGVRTPKTDGPAEDKEIDQ